MNEKFSQNKILVGATLAILATLIWSGNFIIARGSKNDIPPITLAFYRWLSATIILLPFTWHLFIKEILMLKKHFWYFLLTAASGITLFNTFVYIAGHTTEAINMALLGTTTSPIMSVILARIFLKEPVPLTRVIGMLICIAGILLLLSKGSIDILLSFSFTEGDWWMLAAALTFAIYNVCVRKKPSAMSSRNFLFTIFLIGTALLLPFYIYELKTKGGFEINTQNIGAIFYLGLGASVICFLLWNKSIAYLGAGRASLFGNLIPVFSTIEAVLFLNEKVSLIHLYSFILVIAGLIIANLQIKSFIQVLNKK
ncbi:MAG: DMT family transporter [Chitinophagaceae bacterium]|nr:DMT family transporter [Chitinophagaceae bacterium]MBK8312036.1 DMT family transporter [Chitinophagaceae bacterium]MBP6477249.1 DMT family transporter [Chitinophagaceae bacterium]MBP7108706.1 DMT family transporter [Chitinophagaceae bacterium]MBP7313756.1 DMT family transporter [Chitinophagaceae bacterium]